jgi:small-conductance mechanosensitive channel
MPSFISSLKRFFLIVAVLIVAAFGLVFLIDYLIFIKVQITTEISQAIKTTVVISFGLIIVFVVRRSKPILSKYLGTHLAMVFQLLMILIASIVAGFGVLNIFQVSPTSLLLGGGIASIIIGLVISTFVGNILAGTLVLMTRPYSVGDSVMVNNIPGKVEEITSMVTRIKNDMGGMIVIPNTAIIQGGVIVTTFPASDTPIRGRLPYSKGDRIYTTYLNQEGIVSELTPFYTRIRLDSGRELTFLNSSVFTGAVAVARISKD